MAPSARFHRGPQAVLWDRQGTGTGVYLSDADSGAQAVAEAAGQVQEAAVEALWGEGKSTAWPPCPLHPDRHPLTPGFRQNIAFWCCPTTGEVSTPIGA
jgi:hypothetical protein